MYTVYNYVNENNEFLCVKNKNDSSKIEKIDWGLYGLIYMNIFCVRFRFVLSWNLATTAYNVLIFNILIIITIYNNNKYY